MDLKEKDALAVVGIGCRYPGGALSPETFWQMIRSGTDAITEVPEDRWDYRKFFDGKGSRPGKTKVKQGGYLSQNLREFDSMFFGMSPREAAYTDPQQRLLLETTWEAFEDAGMTEEQFRGSNTGVFVGAFNLDHLIFQLSRDNLELVSSFSAANFTMTMLSNRLSFAFDLKGPSVTMDTACSSSLVATHYACQSIWNGDSEMAIAAGVNVIHRPEYMVAMSKGGFLSEHGRCKSFDSDGAGYVRGEGAGVIVLKTLKQAIEDKDDIYALIRHTGVNQDGHTNNGISFPNGDAQRELIQKVYRDSNTDPTSVSYVEAHGTGTKAGDPIEISSIASVVAQNRDRSTPCYVGSVKSNIGHTESAAGVASIIKASLSVRKGEILPNLHFNNPNPEIDFADGRIVVPTRVIPWNEPKYQPRRASVNSFGYGGTNSHAILEQYFPPQEQQQQSIVVKDDARYLIPLSGKNAKAIQENCKNLHKFLLEQDSDKISLNDICHSLAYRRSGLEERIGIYARNQADLVEKLNAVADGEYPDGVVEGRIDTANRNGLVFVFTGMGPQWWAMGQALYESEPVFRASVDDIDHHFRTIAGWSIREEMLADEECSRITQTSIAQPANFVIQAALVELYRSWGIEPSVVVGHSVGEVASAYVCGALSLEDALKVSFHRSRLQQTMAGQGAMLAVGLGGEDLVDLIELYSGVSIAAINSASSVTLSGDAEQLREIAQLLEEQSIFNRMLQVEVPYHSHQMDPIKDELLEVLDTITPRKAKCPVFSTAKGRMIVGEDFSAEYWWDNVRQPVYFEKAIKSMVEEGYTHFLEVGPHPVTRTFLGDCLADEGVMGRVITSLHRKKPENQTFYESLAALFCAGYSLRWPKAVREGRFVRLPTYAWQREEYWNESPLSRRFRLGSGNGHPFMYERVMSPEPAWQVQLNENFFPYIDDHRISGNVVFPGAGYIEAGLAVQRYANAREGAVSLEGLKFERMLMLDDTRNQQLRVVQDREKGAFSIYSSDVNEDNWTRHATGYLTPSTLRRASETLELERLKQVCNQAVNVKRLYTGFAERGLGYGPQFKTIRELSVGEGCVLSALRLPEEIVDRAREHYIIYPALLDGAFQSLIALTDSETGAPMVPVDLAQFTVHGDIANSLYCYGELVGCSDTTIRCDLWLTDETGVVLIEMKGLVCAELGLDIGEDASDSLEDSFYRYQWIPRDLQEESLGAASGEDGWVVLHEQSESDLACALANSLEKKGEACTLVSFDDQFDGPDHLEPGNRHLDALRSTLAKLLQKGVNRILYVADGQKTVGKGEDLGLPGRSVNLTLPLIALGQALSHADEDQGERKPEAVRLCLLTRGAAAVNEGDQLDPSLTGIASLPHLLGNEFTEIQPQHIDIACDSPDIGKDIKAVVDELCADLVDEDVSIRQGHRYVRRLEAMPMESGDIEASRLVHPQEWDALIRVVFPVGDNPRLVLEAPSDKLGKDDVLVQVERMGLHADTVNEQPSLDWSTFIGRVVQTGENVTGKENGQTVVGIHPNPQVLANRVLVKANRCVPLHSVNGLEDALDFAAYVQAAHWLALAGCRKGHSLLIQDAWSTTGLALITLAQRLELGELYVAADDHAQREKLATLGVRRVFDNSDLSYIDELLSETQGRGVDRIINRRADERFTYSFKGLKSGGLLLHAVTDQEDPLVFPDASRRNANVGFLLSQFEDALEANPTLLDELGASLELKQASPLPSLPRQEFNMNNLMGVARTLSEPGAYPECVVSMDSPVRITEIETLGGVQRDSTYLITGGTSGLGLALAKWLAHKGVRGLALSSRRGSSRPEAREFAEQQRALGVQVALFDVDMTDSESVAGMIADIGTTMPPLKGIIHGAMVLDDDLTVRMTPSRMSKVMAPKVTGAVNLHRATQSLPLDHFISISSISSIIGNVGQTNYIAANAFLDGFAHYRRALGLVATTVNLGVLQETGVVARDENLANVLDAKGIQGFSTRDVIRGFGHILNNRPAQVGFFKVDWSTWSRESPKSAGSSRFRELVEKARAHQDMPPALAELLGQLKEQEDHCEHLTKLLSQELAHTLKIPLDDIRGDRNMSEMGIDSLMSVELSRGLRTKYGLEITSMELQSGSSLNQLSQTMASRLPDIA
ncbi:type I polyketide synthase [Marinimicrobium agarilyticum]|uniref:type I polyketide synthase n=1 Tax=Marinimicrobium agarilyticum TaxID=306546 RepID=UPI00041E6151|nr:type I polyketide synthase [Marinimicrobium agarilyticum]